MYCETVFSDTKSCLILQFPSHIVLYTESLSVYKKKILNFFPVHRHHFVMEM